MLKPYSVTVLLRNKGFSGDSDGKESACSAAGSIPGSERCSGYPAHSCLEISMDRGA